jgi:formylglycine-generating enzyme required for sulfatase activity/serine/threonine protein kinase
MENADTQPESIAAAQRREQLKNRVLKNGESFGNYRVVKCMCAGLLTHYYHMQHIRDLHDVTVGVFHHRTEGNAKFLKRLEGLKKTISTFDHVSIPQIRDCTTIDGHICIFLDPVNGNTLSQYFEANAKPGHLGLEVLEVTRLLALLYGALGYAHSQGVDHRDLDSDLIYVQEDGSICLLGLGIKACMGVDLFESIVSASVSPLVSSKTLDRLNSFDVMSPEYKAGVAEDSRVDVFEVAFLGYWLLTGHKAEFAKYVPPSELVAGLSMKWDVFFEQALQRNQDERYQSCKIALLGLKDTSEELEVQGEGLVQRQIDRIPVPRQIVERGKLATRIYRLFVIGLVGVSLTAICASYLSMSYTEEVDYSRDIAKAVEAADPAAVLSLTVEPEVARIKFIGYNESFVVNQGGLVLAVQPGSYRLSISAPDYVPQRVPITIEKNAAAPLNLNIQLKPEMTDVILRTQPGASIRVVDAQGTETTLGIADLDGAFTLHESLVERPYQVLVQKTGYQTQTLEHASIGFGEVSELDVDLLPLPATVQVYTQPSGAQIWLDETELGTTPLSLKELAPGKPYLFVARLDGYRPQGRRIEFKPGADLIVDFGELIPLSGEIHIGVRVLGMDAPEPEQLYDALKVVVDGHAMSFADPALNTIRAGEHRIHLEHPLYISNVRRLTVADREHYELNFDLRPRPAQVQLNLPPQLNAQVLLNGEQIQQPLEQIEIPAGKEVELELQIKNYFTMLRRFKLSPNEHIVWEVEPRRIPGPLVGQDWFLPYSDIAFAWLPAGEFEMGSPLQEHARVPNEGPQTSVRFNYGFWAGIYEVTQAQYQRLTEQNPATFKNDDHPVESITWEQANTFCRLLTDSERDAQRLPAGYVYRLPTEAEWEYAARAGTRTPFFFGEEADASLGQFRGVYPRDREDGLRVPLGSYGTNTVGRYQANAFGLYDVHGNVREWTLDIYNGRLPGHHLVDPEPRQQGTRIVVRGGGWEDSAARVRSAVREEVSPDVASSSLGFRVVLAPEL